MFIPKRALKSSTKPSTIRLQRLCHDLDVHEWVMSVMEQLLFSPMKVAIGFSFLTRHPLDQNISYMFAAPELAFLKAYVREEVSFISCIFYLFLGTITRICGQIERQR